MQLNHEISGLDQAPALLMGGSLGTTLEMWKGQLPLAEQLRLIRFDHRGHGGSPGPPGPYEIADLGADVIDLMDALGLRRASFCGISIGGMVGMWLGANAPERIERLILMCTAASLGPPSRWRERAATVLEAGSTEPIADTVVERWLTPAYARQHHEVRQELLGMLLGVRPDAYAACCGAIERMDLRPALTTIGAPTLVISGADDTAAPLEHQRLIAERIPYCRLEIVSPAAHLAAVERPEAVNQLILEHLS